MGILNKLLGFEKKEKEKRVEANEKKSPEEQKEYEEYLKRMQAKMDEHYRPPDGIYWQGPE